MRQLILKACVSMVAPLGYVCVNPCERCEFAEDTGSDHFCGACRRRPMVYTTDFTDPFLGGHKRTCGYETPRAAYLRRRRWDDADTDDADTGDSDTYYSEESDEDTRVAALLAILTPLRPS